MRRWIDDIGVNQHPGELDEFAAVLAEENVRSYLEIGSKVGCSLHRVALALPVGSRIVSVDLPHGDRSTQPHLEACVADLRERGYDAHLILGDSQRADVKFKVDTLAPFDACLIDANHTLPFVRRDWEFYGKRARIVAFHDISYRRDQPPPKGRLPIEVPLLWREIKSDYVFMEICKCPADNGIGILWRETDAVQRPA